MKKLLLSSGIFLLIASVAPAFASVQQMTDNPIKDSPLQVTVTKAAVVLSDDEVTRKVKDALVADTALAPLAKDITIKTSNGIVTLSGKVDSEKIKNDINTKLNSVAGVKQIVNNLEIKK